VAPFLNLRRAARADGIDLKPLSSFAISPPARDLEWQFSGERPMYDALGVKLNAAALTPWERIEAILLWSRCRAQAAITGARMSTWLTAKATEAGYQIKLTRRSLPLADRSRRWIFGLRTTRRALGSFVPFRACVPACSLNPGISALRQLRKKRGGA